MAAHDLTIAKASLVAACLRPGATQVSREDVNSFHSLLEAAFLRCSPSNIQKCKVWVLEHMVPSLQRVVALGKYLISLCKHLQHNLTASADQIRNSSRRQLHLLYMLNDVLHHTAYHVDEPTWRANLDQGFSPILLELFSIAAAECKLRVINRLQDLLSIWKEQRYFQEQLLQSIGQAIASGSLVAPEKNTNASAAPQRELPYIMPTTHGDQGTPFYDLPAANLMPHMVPNAAIPMKPEEIRALQLAGGPADKNLIQAVQDFLSDVKMMEAPFADISEGHDQPIMDEMGQLSHRNKDDEVVGDTYYGWTRAFCEKMQDRGRASRAGTRSRSPSSKRRSRRSHSRSWSRSRSSSPRRDRSRSYSPEFDRPRFKKGESPGYASQQTARQVQGLLAPAGVPPPPPPPPSMLASNSLPFPLPRPPNWNGPWPPIMPNSSLMSFNPQFGPPPPPPFA